MRLIGLTGGVASGKSTVSRHLEEHGFPIVDTDLIVRELLEHDPRIRQRLHDEFGTVDRGEIRRIVFPDAEKRAKLERIVHPRVAETVSERLAQLRKQRPPRVAAVVVVPLLFEVNWEKLFDVVVAVLCARETQVARLMTRDGIARDLAETMVGSQLPNEEKERRAHHVLRNDGTPADLRGAVDRLLADLSLSPQ